MEMQAQKLVPKLVRLMNRVPEIIRIHRYASSTEKSCVSGQTQGRTRITTACQLIPSLARNYSG